MTPSAEPDDLAEIDGEVATLIYTNDANGWGVVELDDGGRATGPLAALAPGMAVRLVGQWRDHRTHGPTFEAVYFEPLTPRSEKGLAQFLASDRFAGVGEVTAGRLVEAFGLDIGDVIEREPQRLARVKGVSAAQAKSVVEGWREAGTLAALVRRLAEAGLSPALAQAAHRRFGEEALDRLDANPYDFLAVRGITWPQVERLARLAGVEALDERRLAAGAAAAHREACAAGGHVTATTGDLVPLVGRLLRLDAEGAARALALGASARLLAEDDGWWYTPADLAAERGLAQELRRLRDGRSGLPASLAEAEPDPDLIGEQRAAVQAALTSPVSVLTGGPGTGKTRTIVAIVRACEAADLRVALCAPTGRAAKRMEELTGRSASTVHRMLEARPSADGGFVFGYGTQRRLPYDLVVADEWSMADVGLAWALARAVRDGAHLLLVGDVDQLPSVGPGAVLRDVLERAAGVPSTRLATIHRQAAESRIVTLAHEVNAGEVAGLRGNMGDVFAVAQAPEGLADRIAEIVAVRGPAHFGCRPQDVQVLAPMYRGPGGVHNLNARLKERLNPSVGRPAVLGWHEGDRVVQTRNDADLDVANGDVGEVAATDRREGVVEVAFPHGTVTYDAARAGDLAPAWCLTVHKSQGGEWPVVVLALDPAHRPMLWRELVYTAITRASRGLLLVGDPGLVAAAARRTGSGTLQRRTRLASRLASVNPPGPPSGTQSGSPPGPPSGSQPVRRGA